MPERPPTPPPLRFLFFGAGAVGSLLGARLAQAGSEVTLELKRNQRALIRQLSHANPRRRLDRSRIWPLPARVNLGPYCRWDEDVAVHDTQ